LYIIGTRTLAQSEFLGSYGSFCEDLSLLGCYYLWTTT